MKITKKDIMYLLIIIILLFSTHVSAQNSITYFGNGNVNQVTTLSGTIKYLESGQLSEIKIGSDFEIFYDSQGALKEVQVNAGSVRFDANGSLVQFTGDLNAILNHLKNDLTKFIGEVNTYLATQNTSLVINANDIIGDVTVRMVNGFNARSSQIMNYIPENMSSNVIAAPSLGNTVANSTSGSTNAGISVPTKPSTSEDTAALKEKVSPQNNKIKNFILKCIIFAILVLIVVIIIGGGMQIRHEKKQGK